MIQHSEIADKELWELIRNREVTVAGNKKLKIYGTLQCKSGKSMKRTNRVFFVNEEEAIEQGYRSCGNCMRSMINL